jgi:hypothetical protein
MMFMIKKPIQGKFSGEESDLKEVLQLLARDVEVVTSSTFIPNQTGNGCHIFVTLVPKVMRTLERVKT